MGRSIVLALLLLVALCPAAEACRKIKFHNRSDAVVTDLHIEFSKGLKITNPGAFNPDNQDGQATHNLAGGALPPGTSTDIECTVDPPPANACQNIEIKRWFWTINNDPDVAHLGEPVGYFTPDGGNATGDGVVIITVAGMEHPFTPTPGDTPAQTNARFQTFIDGLLDGSGDPLLYRVDDVALSTTFAGNVIGDPDQMLDAHVQTQDSGQNLRITVVPEVVTGVRGWGPRPRALSLSAPHPNPSIGVTGVDYALPEPGDVRITVHDAQGRQVAVLVRQRMEAGEHSCSWDGRSTTGSRAHPGLYFIRLRAASGTRSSRLILER